MDATINSLNRDFSRLGFLIIVSILIHALVILGINFDFDFELEKSPELDVTLSQAPKAVQPDQPQVKQQELQVTVIPEQKAKTDRLVATAPSMPKPVRVEKPQVAPEPESVAAQPAQTVPAKIEISGMDILYKAREYVQSNAFIEELQASAEFISPQIQAMYEHADILTAEPPAATGFEAYRIDDRVQVAFAYAPNIVAEIQDDDPLDDLDTPIWRVMLLAFGS